MALTLYNMYKLLSWQCVIFFGNYTQCTFVFVIPDHNSACNGSMAGSSLAVLSHKVWHLEQSSNGHQTSVQAIQNTEEHQLGWGETALWHPGASLTHHLWAFDSNLVTFPWQIIIWSSHNFGHGMTAELSCHVQNCGLIGSLDQVQKEYWEHFELWAYKLFVRCVPYKDVVLPV